MSETGTVKMEINGHPYYIKSKGNVPYLYDVDTNDEVGYWSSKKGQYVMFSLYNRLMKEKYECKREESEGSVCSSDSETEDDEDEEDEEDNKEYDSSSCDEDEEDREEESSSQDEDEDEDEEESRVETKKQMSTFSLMFIFLILFLYLTLQKEFQSIYFDFAFLIFINLLHIFKVFEILNHEE
jgi:hypothetical protein